MSTLSRNVNTPGEYNLDLPGRGTLQDKIYIGFVKVADDVLRMGRLKVWIPELSGDPNDENGWFIVNYCSPFAGATNVYDNKNDDTDVSSQKSYGMWFVPPDINNEVVCCFINGDPARGIWLGCLFQQFMNHMVPGIPGNDSTEGLPVTEYNKKLNQTDLSNPSRPIYTVLADQLVKQGLDQDSIRGVTSSGARRNDPANDVYGILTPGGHQFVFDDSPTNSYIRLRTPSGAQLLINDTVGSIYLNSVDGKNWISMDANGRVNIYGADDISIRSQGSLNLRADRDINIEAAQNINIKARGDTQSTPTANPTASSAPPETPVNRGPTEVIGDSIAVGVGARLQGVVTYANVGDNSTTIWNKLQTQPDLKNPTNAILSVGSNDIVNGQGNQARLTENLNKIRNYLNASNFIWLLPYDSVAKNVVKTFAESKNDKILDLSTYPTSDNLHPRNYALVANDAQALCIPAASNSNVSTSISNVSTSNSNVSTTTSSSTSNVSTGNTAVTTTQSYVEIVTPFLVAHEGFPRGGNAYWDPAGQRDKVSIGYGHQIKPNEYAQGYIDCGIGGRCAVTRGNANNSTPGSGTMPQAQATELLKIDIPSYAATVRRIIGQGTWEILGPYQQAALTSVCYNYPAAITTIKNNGATTFMASRDIESVARMIETVATTVSGQPNAALQQRRRDEANLYRQRPDLIGSAGPLVVGGETLSGTGTNQVPDGGIGLSDSSIQNGYIRIQSRNSLHMLSGQHIFVTSEQDQHRFTGGNLFDSASKNMNILAGGYINESANQQIAIVSSSSISMYSSRIDLNGAQPPIASAAAAAQGPGDLKQTDAILNSLGNVTLITTDTICYQLPFHEPYDNHGGRNFESIRDATRLNSNLNLRAGEVISNSPAPLDIYGTPRSDMPAAVYRGIEYNSNNQPIYQYESELGNVALSSIESLTISEFGKQFIKSRENGSYVVISTGQPPKKQIGYGHDLTSNEISTNTVLINGTSISLGTPLTQPQITQLFDDDINLVQNWIKPIMSNVAVTQLQFDMLCSLGFNIGENNFRSSPAIQSIKNGDLQNVPNQWMEHSLNAAGSVVPGLVNRRRAEVINYMRGPDVNRSQSAVSNSAPADPGAITVIPAPTN